MIGRELQHRRRVFQFFLPVGKLLIDDLASQPLALPGGVIDILQRQVGKLRRFSLNFGVVKGGQFLGKNAHRPAIADNVMNVNQKVMISVA